MSYVNDTLDLKNFLVYVSVQIIPYMIWLVYLEIHYVKLSTIIIKIILMHISYFYDRFVYNLHIT